MTTINDDTSLSRMILSTDGSTVVVVVFLSGGALFSLSHFDTTK